MIEIATLKGDKYSFDPLTLEVYLNGMLQDQSFLEPIFCDDADGEPIFSGILNKVTNQIISRTGHVNNIDSNID